jgi:endonuclease-3
MNYKSRISRIVENLDRAYPNARCTLDYKTPFQLAVATILSAQCTDERVNKVTPTLFAAYPTADKMAKAQPQKVEALVRSTGFYKTKAKAIIRMSSILVKQFGGNLPKTIQELVSLPGIGRKTANVILNNAFSISSGIVVDTHVSRLSKRLGFTLEKTPEKIEKDLMKLIPNRHWIRIAHQLIHHGRQICKARKPACNHCVLSKLCPKIGVLTSAK